MSLIVIHTVCPQKIQSLGIDTIFDAIFYEASIKKKVYCSAAATTNKRRRSKFDKYISYVNLNKSSPGLGWPLASSRISSDRVSVDDAGRKLGNRLKAGADACCIYSAEARRFSNVRFGMVYFRLDTFLGRLAL